MRVAAPRPSTTTPHPERQSDAATLSHRIRRLHRSDDRPIARQTKPSAVPAVQQADPLHQQELAIPLAPCSYSDRTSHGTHPSASNISSARIAITHAAGSTPFGSARSAQTMPQVLPPLRGSAGDHKDALTGMTSCSCIQSTTKSTPAKVWPSPKGYERATGFDSLVLAGIAN